MTCFFCSCRNVGGDVMFYEIQNLDKMENELILVRKYLMNRFLNKVKYDDRFYIYDYKIRFHEDIRCFNMCLNNFIDFFRTNYKNESEMIKLYNYLNFLDYDKIYVKNGKYTIKRKDCTVSDKIQHFPINYKEILENLINFQILHNLKRFDIVFNPRYYDDNILHDPYYDRFWDAKS